jgi:acyl carrier protein
MQDQKDIIEEIAKHLGVTSADIDMQASLRDDLGLGPIEIADLLAYLAQHFQVSFIPSETDGLDTVNDLVVMVEDLMIE